MLVADVLHSCADEGVAAAAVASLGGGFAASLRAEADRCGLGVGRLVASLVASFARDASERDRRALSAAMCGADQPVLVGLRFIAERGLGAGSGPRPMALDAPSAALLHRAAAARCTA